MRMLLGGALVILMLPGCRLLPSGGNDGGGSTDGGNSGDAGDLCLPDTCHGHGVCVAGTCPLCNTGYAGVACDQCVPGYTGYPDCAPDLCATDPCNGHGVCTGGTCTQCDTGYAGVTCHECAPGYTGYPNCVRDPCSPDPCNGHGVCTDGMCMQCNVGYTGATCNQCAANYSGYPNCAAGPWVERWTQNGETATSSLGLDAISFGPDTNGDGVGDVLVGAYSANGYEGAAYLYSGSDGSLLRAWMGEGGNGGNFGMAVSLGPDVTGDGRGDVLIAAPTKRIGTLDQAGRIHLYDGVTGQVLRTWDGTIAWGWFGYSVSLGPDTDGDDRGDVLVGMMTPTGSVGNAYLYSGSSGAPLRTFMGSEIEARFGAAVVLGPDVSGDGRGDVLVAENMATVGTNTRAGKVHLYSGASGLLLRTFGGQVAGERLGLSIALGPDANGDGVPDVAAGTSVAYNGSAANAGKVYLFSSATGTLIRAWSGPHSGSRLGMGLSLGPDADGDGKGDLLVGSETNGFAALFSTGTGQMLNLWSGASSRLGQALALTSDINGDNKPEVVIASPSESAGRGAVRLHISNRGLCSPNCAGRCGGASDGCGGNCTAVPAGSICSEQFLIPDPCSPDPCNGHGVCSLGGCICSAGFTGATCNQCAPGYANYPTCSPMCTQASGSTNITPGLNSMYPSIAWNGMGWGAVYRDARGGLPLKIFFARLDTSGARQAGSEVQVATGDYPDIAYASSYGRYGVVWANSQIWLACIDASGTVLATRQVTTAGQIGSTRPRIVSTGTNFGIAWNDYSSGTHRVYTAVFSANSCAQIGTNGLISSGYGADPAIAYASVEYGIIWQATASTIMFARADQSGNKVAGSEVSIADAGAGLPTPRIAWNSARSEYGVVYVDGSSSPTTVRFARLNGAGMVQGGVVRLSAQFVAMYPTIAPAAANYGIAWFGAGTGGGIQFLRTDYAGAMLSPVMALATSGNTPAVGWDGNGFLVAYPANDVYTTRVTCP